LGPDSGPRVRMGTDVLRASTDSRADGRRMSCGDWEELPATLDWLFEWRGESLIWVVVCTC
jgi:hypothetical protein